MKKPLIILASLMIIVIAHQIGRNWLGLYYLPIFIPEENKVYVKVKGEEYRVIVNGLSYAKRNYKREFDCLPIKLVAARGWYQEINFPFIKSRFFMSVSDYSSLPYASDRDQEILNEQETFNLPMVALSIPGTWGSSGTFLDSVQNRGVEVINAAIDQILEQFPTEKVCVAGHSLGGNYAAFLMTLRTDIKCSIMSAAPLDRQGWLVHRSMDEFYAGERYFANPMDVVPDIFFDDKRREIIIFNQYDRVVPPDFILPFFLALKERGHDPELMLANTQDENSEGHNLSIIMLAALQSCMNSNGRLMERTDDAKGGA